MFLYGVYFIFIKIIRNNNNEYQTLILGALLHDIGKFLTKLDGDKEITLSNGSSIKVREIKENGK